MKFSVGIGIAAVLACWALAAQRAAAAPGVPTSAGAAPTHTAPAGGTAMLATPGAAEDVALGRRIYLDGVGEGGKPITGVRFGGVVSQGAALACATCHKRSGLGSTEGTDTVSPIAGRFIFQETERAVASMNVRTLRKFNQLHEPLDDASFAASVREGQHVSGRELSTIMPRYEISDTELRGLRAYLRGLSATWSPGVTAQQVELATVITPDVTPERREAFLKTLKAAVAQKNGNFAPGMRTMSTAAEMMLRTNRFWNLQVWELRGAPDTWAAQLARLYDEKPVFAMLSGLGGGDWEPVHQFCETREVPCWFPSVTAPPQAARSGRRALYFSAGVALEAEVLASHLQARPVKRLVQVHLGDAAGNEAVLRAQESVARLPAPKGRARPQVSAVALDATASDDALRAALRSTLAGLQAGDALMLWWPDERLGVLADVAPPAAARYLSARMAPHAEERLALGWRQEGTHLLYPYQLPDKRHATLFYMHAWLKERQLPVVDEVLQSEVYFATSYFADTLTDMLDNLHRDYLLERGESMLSIREGQKSEDEARDLINAKHQKSPAGGGAQGASARLAAMGNVQDRRMPRPIPGRQDHLQARREGTSIYPRLSLAPGQRFASKGAYVVEFTTGGALASAAEWIVP